jgi:hypothetical protein
MMGTCVHTTATYIATSASHFCAKVCYYVGSTTRHHMHGTLANADTCHAPSFLSWIGPKINLVPAGSNEPRVNCVSQNTPYQTTPPSSKHSTLISDTAAEL